MNSLTPRELEILQALSEGKCFKQIGNYFTLKNQTMNIRRKLNVVNNVEAVAKGLREKIIQ